MFETLKYSILSSISLIELTAFSEIFSQILKNILLKFQ